MDVNRNNLAPIVLFVYNRPWHTEQTLNALIKNELASNSTLYIFADGPKSGCSQEELNKINKVRKIIYSQKWCKEVIIYEKGINDGLANSIIQGVSQILKKYDKTIVLEDDIITSKYFLTFMNDALVEYKNCHIVKSIAGYLEPIKTKEKKPFFLGKGTSWGWATWQRVWNEIEWDIDKLIKEFIPDERKIILNFSNYPYYDMLKLQKENKIDSWAIRFYASCVLKDGLHLTPPKSLVRNIGFDGSGEHCQNDNFMVKSIVHNKKYQVAIIDIKANTTIPKLIQFHREKMAKKISHKKTRINTLFNILKKTNKQ